jgi:acyl carrier protein phosphodiesterase
MNYLAHARLSFDDPAVLTGNMISDFVKGRKQYDYPRPIRDGISLHRAIDGFTDTHEATARAKSFFRPVYRLYSGALVDVVYDHFLANDPGEFPGDSLADFAGRTYRQLAAKEESFPEKFARIFPYMRSQNWLLNYRSREGILSSFAGLNRRAAAMPAPEAAFEVFCTRYRELHECYSHFFPALKGFAMDRLASLTDTKDAKI